MEKGLFEDEEITKLYAQYRPSYLEELKQCIVDYVKKTPDCEFNIALDVACGSGQSTLMWQNQYEMVYGIDISKNQLKHAPDTIDNVKFSIGSAEHLPFEESSIDLITTAMSLQYFDQNKFFAEAKRVLKSGGVVCAYQFYYSGAELDTGEGTALFHQVLNRIDVTKSWPKEVIIGREKFRNLSLPFKDFQRCHIKSSYDWYVDQLVGFVSSMKGYVNYMEVYKDPTLLDNFRKKLTEIYHADKLTITFPFHILLGRN